MKYKADGTKDGLQILSDLDHASYCLSKRAQILGVNKYYESPFYLDGLKMGEDISRGGKLDDVTVIVAQVTAKKSEREVKKDNSGVPY
mmetsp:Transcript_13396/g.22817  ORF Transcript_13396/g.22817 Transcript_13396/m.22817 type:complete len:88 (-) Transcript_13396:146-409(-)